MKHVQTEASNKQNEVRNNQKVYLCLVYCDFLAYLVRPGFTVHKVFLLNTLHVFVLLQVLTHLHMFWVGLEVGVSCRCRLIRLLQLKVDKRKRDVNKIIITETSYEKHKFTGVSQI